MSSPDSEPMDVESSETVKGVMKEWSLDSLMYKEETIAYLNANFIENILRKNLNEPNLKVLRIEKSPAVEKGENYGSIPVKVLVVYKNESSEKKMHLIVKSCPNFKTEIKKIFKKENFFYEKIWPKIAKILRLTDYRHPAYFVPRHYSGGPETSIIMEDLCDRGFRNVPRHHRLDFEHCKLVFKRLAEFHAASIKLRLQDPELRKNNFENTFEDENTFMEKMYKNALYILSKEILLWHGYEHFSPRLEKLSKTISQKIKKIRSSNNGRITVLNHGDCWSNNILFHYPKNSDIPDAAVLVDYQIFQWGTPAIDLIYFFYISAQLEVVMNKFETLVDYYVSEVHQTLTILNLPISMFADGDLWADVDDSLIMGVANTCSLQIVTQAEKGQPIDFIQVINGQALDENSQWRQTIANVPGLKKYIKTVLDYASAKYLL